MAKVVAWLAPGTVVWLLASIGLAPNDAATARGVAALLVGAGGAVAWRYRDNLSRFFRDSWSTLVGIEATFLVGFAAFASIRALNPAIFWGEKPMDYAILNACSPRDQYASLIRGSPARISTISISATPSLVFTLISGVPSAFAFNLALATIGAMLVTMVCALVYQLTRRLGAVCRRPGGWPRQSDGGSRTAGRNRSIASASITSGRRPGSSPEPSTSIRSGT